MDKTVKTILGGNDYSFLVEKKPRDWVPFLKQPLSDECLKAIVSKDYAEEIDTLQRRYHHLVREKVIQGNISDVGLETPIFRTMTCKNFHNMLESKALHLSSPLEWAKWGDSWEASVISGGVCSKDLDGKLSCVTEQVKRYLTSWYGQSWSLTEECDAIWSRYTQEGGRAVRISTTPRKLMHALFRDDKFHRTTFLNRISYLSDAEIEEAKRHIKAPLGSEESIRALLSLKRKVYEYENEVRLLVWDQDGENKGKVGESYDFPWVSGRFSFIESVVFDPDCPEECLKAENALMHEHGYPGNATRSTLKEPSMSLAIITPDNRC